MNVKQIRITVIVLSIILFCSLLCSAYFAGRGSGKRIAVNFSYNDNSEITTWRYMALDCQLSNYICDLSKGLGLDPDLAVAHLMEENPEFNPRATHVNENGTIDIGEFQLNDRYVWTTFKDRYWFDNIELNPFNWKHNTYIALHHMKWLQEKLKNQDDAIMAYNCGEGPVMNGRVPASTIAYCQRVKNNLYLLKNQKGVEGN